MLWCNLSLVKRMYTLPMIVGIGKHSFCFQGLFQVIRLLFLGFISIINQVVVSCFCFLGLFQLLRLLCRIFRRKLCFPTCNAKNSNLVLPAEPFFLFWFLQQLFFRISTTAEDASVDRVEQVPEWKFLQLKLRTDILCIKFFVCSVNLNN